MDVVYRATVRSRWLRRVLKRWRELPIGRKIEMIYLLSVATLFAVLV